jgi:hypothetical protein
VPKSACDPNAQGAADMDDADDDSAATAPSPANEVVVGRDPGTFILKLRSTLEVIQYVGQVLALQDRETYDDATHNPNQIPQCITLEPQSRESGPARQTCGNDGELFDLVTTNQLADDSNPGVEYDGQLWSLPPPPNCPDGNFDDCFEPDKYDHTLETMSIISLLLNQNKSAKDIATTPAVQAVP